MLLSMKNEAIFSEMFHRLMNARLQVANDDIKLFHSLRFTVSVDGAWPISVPFYSL